VATDEIGVVIIIETLGSLKTLAPESKA